jgi:inorganic phosphate transporter, PiT family
MSEADLILYIVVATAIAFDFTNGFHDTANVVATSISTRAMAPRLAVGYAAVLNFAGAFISLEVAATVAEDGVAADLITPTVVFAGLIGAIAWNLATWYLGLPSSSSHALIGGVVGSAFAAVGSEAILSDGLVGKVLIPALVAPILAFAVGSRSSSATGCSDESGRAPCRADSSSASWSRAGCWPSRTERTTPRRRWESSRSR